jgi:Na+/H+ antiporter NhaD/arsenite permease-like protein
MATTPLWATLPFAAYLISIAFVPVAFASFWRSNRHKLGLAAAASAPVLAYVAWAPGGGAALGGAIIDYLGFMSLLAALFTISAGIGVRGALAGSTCVNTTLLATGAALASVIGTMGASVLLIRPLLRANARRGRVAHVVVFFIFIVSNGAGLLTPLGPPLLLGFLHGVPFTWTLRLAPQWALVNGGLLGIFALVDRVALARDAPGAAREPAEPGPLRLDGARNVIWLGALVVFVFFTGGLPAGAGRAAAEIVGPALLATLSFKTTPPDVHERNDLSFEPLLEVAAIFVGIFITMVPAMSYLAERGAALGLTKPWQFFWVSGALSSVLDNAPTYLMFAALASGVVFGPGAGRPAADLGALAAHPHGRDLLAAVSCGAVFMGAMTYIGNGPNFMVKAIAEQHRVRMPSFLGYMAWSCAILGPLLGILAYLFF